MKTPFIAMLWIVEELLNKEILLYDPTDKNRMLIYHTSGTKYPEGWYSENIHEAVSELIQSKKDTEYIKGVAKKAGIDVDDLIEKANEMIS